MPRPIVTFHDTVTDTYESREMNDDEFAEFTAMQTQAQADAEAKATADAAAQAAKQAAIAKLAAIGLTADDVNALFG